jgi:hypothetical protein
MHKASTGGWDNQIYWGNTTFGANQEAYVTIAQLSSDSWELSLMLKSQSRTSYASGVIEVVYSASSNSLEVWTYDPIKGGVQYGASITSLILTTGDQLGVSSLADGTLQIYKNGTLIATRNLSGWSYADDPGYIGLWFANASGQKLDNFGGGTR